MNARFHRWLQVILALVAPVWGGSAARAQSLSTAFTYQGELRESGTPASGLHDLRFRLYDAAIDGAQIGPTVCLDDVALVEGRFTVSLDFGQAFAGDQRFLEIDVRADSGLDCGSAAGFVQLDPRQAVTAAPYAAFSHIAATAGSAATAATAGTATTAANATQLNGQLATFYQNAANLSSGTLADGRLAGTYSGALMLINAGNQFTGSGAGLTSLDASNLATGTLDASRLPVPLSLTGAVGGTGLINATNSSTSARAVFGQATAASGATYGGYFQAASTGAIGVVGAVTAPTGPTYGVYGQSDSTTGRAVIGVATSGAGVNFGGRFETNSTDGYGLYARANSATGPNIGVAGVTQSTTGWGVFGVATAGSGQNYGVRGESTSSSGYGVYGQTTATTGTNYGGYFRAAGTSGRGVVGWASSGTGNTLGGYFESQSTNGSGVLGLASALSGNTSAGYFQAQSPTGIGVLGRSVAGSGISYGGYFDTNSATGRAVYGEATAGTGINYGGYFESQSTSGRGVYARVTPTTGTIYAVYGQASTSASGYAVYGAGDMGASGVKPFRIDHPQDPANKYLLHYAAESPEVINFYSGKVTLDGAGEAVVELPAYFAAINRDPRYSLTALGAAMPTLHVADEIRDEDLSAGELAAPGEPLPVCSFRIAGGVPGARVSWEVKALRNDLRVRLHGAPVEREKTGPERGTYQHPEYYGQPPEMGLDHTPRRSRETPPVLSERPAPGAPRESRER